MNTPIQNRRPKGQPCSVDCCERVARARGLCNAHYLRFREGRALDTPLRGYGIHRRRTEEGYIELWARSLEGTNSRRYIYEHRYVMSQVLGRPLRPNERVHHRNGKRDDNRPENLELWISSHPAGQRVDELVTWAREILAEYGGLEISG